MTLDLQHIRALAMFSFRSSMEWQKRFHGRRSPKDSPNFCADFEVEHYVEAQGEKLSDNDPNSLLYVSKVWKWVLLYL